MPYPAMTRHTTGGASTVQTHAGGAWAALSQYLTRSTLRLRLRRGGCARSGAVGDPAAQLADAPGPLSDSGESEPTRDTQPADAPAPPHGTGRAATAAWETGPPFPLTPWMRVAAREDRRCLPAQ
ncbi:hypothetical protein GCM10010116_59160 [Microbispora rosea subsp. aerata]|nr:hypothetical protein GCM10010116_59160 [Microbispora rosea subsp. aerata]GIH58896.1 hypothetical protein Mro02_58100 [Microbispora rosea subsp. aerata]GLJ85916.1 hypothetical protein GCM10017588_46490 [Microbispora rosea subsp. aerata]